MDVMGLGAEKGKLPGDWHFVIGELTAAAIVKRLHDQGFELPTIIRFLDGVLLPEGWRSFSTILEVTPPHETANETKEKVRKVVTGEY